ncbi:Uncharacterised protein [Vibrio cholerae]|nr:Uncharacterised protein [Vibrio cholerae]CSD03266.1 Uncharacterised protein [Vibrio cholerae]
MTDIQKGVKSRPFLFESYKQLVKTCPILDYSQGGARWISANPPSEVSRYFLFISFPV